MSGEEDELHLPQISRGASSSGVNPEDALMATKSIKKKKKKKRGQTAAEVVPAEPGRQIFARDISPVTMFIYWDPWEKNTGFPVSGYRIAQCRFHKGEQQAYEVIVHNTHSLETEMVVTNLRPDTIHKFKISALTYHDETYKMISGTTVESPGFKTEEAPFHIGWFFESEEEMLKQWRVFFGDPQQDMKTRIAKGEMHFADSLEVTKSIPTDQLAAMVMTRTQDYYYLGTSSCHLPFEGTFGGGIYADVMVDPSREYNFTARLRHSHPPEGRTTIQVWDHELGWVKSVGAELFDEWEMLEVSMPGTSSYSARFHIQVAAGYQGELWIDDVEVVILGRSKLATAANQLETAVDEDMQQQAQHLQLDVVGCHHLPHLHMQSPCNPKLSVTLDKAVVARGEKMLREFDPPFKLTANFSLPAGKKKGKLAFAVTQDADEMIGQAKVQPFVLRFPPAHTLWLCLERKGATAQEEEGVLGITLRKHNKPEAEREVPQPGTKAEQLDLLVTGDDEQKLQAWAELAEGLELPENLIELLDLKRAWVTSGLIREAIFALESLPLLPHAMTFLHAFLTFEPSELGKSADIHLAKAACQRYLYHLGVLNPLEVVAEGDKHSKHVINMRKEAPLVLKLIELLTLGSAKSLVQTLEHRPALFRYIVGFLETEEAKIKPGSKVAIARREEKEAAEEEAAKKKEEADKKKEGAEAKAEAAKKKKEAKEAKAKAKAAKKLGSGGTDSEGEGKRDEVPALERGASAADKAKETAGAGDGGGGGKDRQVVSGGVEESKGGQGGGELASVHSEDGSTTAGGSMTWTESSLTQAGSHVDGEAASVLSDEGSFVSEGGTRHKKSKRKRRLRRRRKKDRPNPELAWVQWSRAVVRLLNAVDQWPEQVVHLWTSYRHDIPMDDLTLWRSRALLALDTSTTQVTEDLKAAWAKEGMAREVCALEKTWDNYDVLRIQEPQIDAAQASVFKRHSGFLVRRYDVDDFREKQKDPNFDKSVKTVTVSSRKQHSLLASESRQAVEEAKEAEATSEAVTRRLSQMEKKPRRSSVFEFGATTKLEEQMVGKRSIILVHHPKLDEIILEPEPDEGPPEDGGAAAAEE